MTLEEAFQEIINGRALLFTGAGFPTEAVNIAGNVFKDGKKLAKYLMEICGEEDEDGDLQYASEVFLEHKTESELLKLLKEEYTCKSVQDFHQVIVNNPWKNVYTTNYDNIINFCNPSLSQMTINQDTVSPATKQSFCLHINGSLNNINSNSLHKEFKLTKQSYLEDQFMTSPWKKFFVNDLATARAIFFIGYSLNDFDINKLLYDNKDLKEKTFFITSAREDKKRDRKLSPYGTILSVGIKNFAEQLSIFKKDAMPIKTAQSFDSFEYIQEVPDTANVTLMADDFYRYIIFGKISFPQICKSIMDDVPFFIFRKSIHDIYNKIIQKYNQVFIMHSDIGNGKTQIIEGLKYLLLTKSDYQIFQFKKEYMSINEELEYINKTTKPTIVIIESYHTKYELLKKIHLHENITLLLTERTLVNDASYDRAAEFLNCTPEEIDINTLCEDDIRNFVESLKINGLLTEYAGNREKAVRDFKEKYESELSLILLYVLKSDNIQKKYFYLYEKIRNEISDQKSFYKSFIAILVLSSLFDEIDIFDIRDLLADQHACSNEFLKNEMVQQIIERDRSRVYVKSSLLAKYILTNLVGDSKFIIEVISIICRNAANNAQKSGLFETLRKELIRFSSLENLLPQTNRLISLQTYYDGLKNISIFNENPHFWLQYAIAMRSMKEFELAERFFESAYQYAKNKHYFNLGIIDNHYSKFLLDRSIMKPSKNNIEFFRKAHTIVLNQIRSDKYHFYPYKVAAMYRIFFESHQKILDTVSLSYVIKASELILEKVNDIKDERLQNNQKIKECKHALSKMLEYSN